MDLVRDVLDKQLVDPRGRALGRADSLVLEVRPGRPPRVVEIEVGAATLARRLGRRIERWTIAILKRWGPHFAQPVRFPIALVRTWGINLVLEIPARETDAMRWERWWSEHVIGRIPGGRSK